MSPFPHHCAVLQPEEPAQSLEAEPDASEGPAAAPEGPAAGGRRRRRRRLKLRRRRLEPTLLLLRRRRLERPGGGGGGGRAGRAEAGRRAAAGAGAAAQLGETLDSAGGVCQHRAPAVLRGQLLAARHSHTLTVGLLKHGDICQERPRSGPAARQTGQRRSRSREQTVL